jgi:hypothetical protein
MFNWKIIVIISLFLYTLLSLFNVRDAKAVDVKTYIPINSLKYLPMLRDTQRQFFPDLPTPWYLGGLIEQESCISLTYKSCWNPTTQLKTSREWGAGLSQITVSYAANGAVRGDNLADLRRRHYAELKEMSWSNIIQRPDLQIRSIILMTRDNYKTLYNVSDTAERINFADAAYNGGMGGLNKDRRLCGLTRNCNPQIWFKNVEVTCSKSKKAIYGNRSACDINRTHVSSVRYLRMNKYEKYFN